MAYICFGNLDALPWILAFLAAMAGAFGFIVTVVAIFIAGTPEEDIEMELRECRRRSSAKRD